jgi:prepilin-type N-terminal cleavage/methylation domain-containing protein
MRYDYFYIKKPVRRPFFNIRGITLIEMLVALAISGIFLAGVLETFISIVRSSNKAAAKLESVTNARTALEIMSINIKSARIDPRRPIQFFKGESLDLLFGDAVDDDNDGQVDEELMNGSDDDGDYLATEDDLHTDFGSGLYERKDFLNVPDVGDAHVDEDCRFANDTLEFITFPDPDNPGFREKRIRFEITTFDGEANVLVRTITYNPNDPLTSYSVSDPLAFNILSLNFQYWDPNRIPMSWVNSWDSLYAPMFPDPQIELPVAVRIFVQVYSGTEPFDEYQAGQRIDTVKMETIVNIEQILKDARYRNLM